ncbi:MAG: helix-turn-helix domain-containing protein [Candidatus Nanohaloarchaea archaeon]
MDDELWSKLSYVEMSKNRTETLRVLSESEKPMTPTEVSEELDIAFNSASRALRQLSEKELVECINPEAPRYRRYRLTEDGEKISQNL